MISVCSRAARHLAKLWFQSTPVAQHQARLNPVYVMSDVPAQKFKKADNLCSGTPSGSFLHMLASKRRSLLCWPAPGLGSCSVCTYESLLVQVTPCDIVGKST